LPVRSSVIVLSLLESKMDITLIGQSGSRDHSHNRASVADALYATGL
jgi:hypothetical protein